MAVLAGDITAERAAHEGMSNAVEYINAIVESAADAILTVDAAGRIAGLNAAAGVACGGGSDQIGGADV